MLLVMDQVVHESNVLAQPPRCALNDEFVDIEEVRIRLVWTSVNLPGRQD